MIYQFHLKLSRRSKLSVETVVDGKILHIGFGFFCILNQKLVQIVVLFTILTTCCELQNLPFYLSYNIRVATTFSDLTGKKKNAPD